MANVAVGNPHYDEFLSLVAAENPDLLIIEEYTPAWEMATESLKTKYPYSLGNAKQGGAGIALFSRLPLNDPRLIDFDASAHDGIFASVEMTGTTLQCVAIHPLPPTRGDKFASRNRQLVDTAQLLRSVPGPKVLIGDLNTSIWSPYYRDLVRDAGMRDARLGFGSLPTWPNRLPAFVRIPIDNCLVSDGIFVEQIRTGPDIGSDHLPLNRRVVGVKSREVGIVR